MNKMKKLLLCGLIATEGLCASIVVDESLKKVDTVPKWISTLGRSTITVLISGCTILAISKIYGEIDTKEESIQKDDDFDEDTELEFEDDLD